MKILVINTIPFDLNGMSTVIFNYFKYMNRKNIEFHFLVNEYIDVNIKREITQLGGTIHLMHGRNSKPWKYVWNLRKLAKTEKFDVVHIHGNSATMEFELLAFKGLKAKKIVHVHGVNTQHPIVHNILYPFFKSSYDIAFAASRQSGEWLIKNRKYEIINNGIDTRRFAFDAVSRKKVRKELGIKEENPVILHVGAFSEQKNHDFLVRVFQRVHSINPNVVLILVGKGKNMGEIKKYCQTHQLRSSVKFLGERDNTEKYYSAADLFLFPSRFEPFGIVTLEAQCSGLNVVVSDVLPRSIDVTNKVSFLSLSEGYDFWAKKTLEKLNTSVRDRDKNNFNDLFVKKNYSITENANEMRKIYMNLLSK